MLISLNPMENQPHQARETEGRSKTVIELPKTESTIDLQSRVEELEKENAMMLDDIRALWNQNKRMKLRLEAEGLIG